MLEAIPSSKMSVLTKVTWHYIPKDGILNGWNNFLSSNDIS
jgi:hypothetical protein